MSRQNEKKTNFGIWESAKLLLEFSTWLPEVTGSSKEILRMGLYRKNPDGQRKRLVVTDG